jgi:hypothetical protein
VKAEIIQARLEREKSLERSPSDLLVATAQTPANASDLQGGQGLGHNALMGGEEADEGRGTACLSHSTITSIVNRTHLDP